MNTAQGDAYINWGQSTCVYCGAVYTGFHSCSSQSRQASYCGTHQVVCWSGPCPHCVNAAERKALEARIANLEEQLRRQGIINEANYGYGQERFDAFYQALGHTSVRIDLAQGQLNSVADQADRSDAAQTNLESQLLDLQDAHNRLVIFVGELEERLLEVEAKL
jgi:hypothetical protein